MLKRYYEDKKPDVSKYFYSDKDLKLSCENFITEWCHKTIIAKATSIMYNSDNDVLEIYVNYQNAYNGIDINAKIDILFNSIENLINESNANYTGYDKRMAVSYKLDKVGNGIANITKYIAQFITIIFKSITFLINIPHMILYFIFGVLQMMYKDRNEKELKEKYENYCVNLLSHQTAMRYEDFKKKEPIEYSKYNLGVWIAAIEHLILAIHVTIFGTNIMPPIAIIILMAYISMSHIYSYKFVLNFFKKHNLI